MLPPPPAPVPTTVVEQPAKTPVTSAPKADEPAVEEKISAEPTPAPVVAQAVVKTPAAPSPTPPSSTGAPPASESTEPLGDLEDQVFKFSDEPAVPKIQRRDRIAGLSDYGAFCRDVDRRLAEYQREGGAASLLLVSVDECQKLADQYGQKTLELALRNTAQIVKATRREMDHAARCNDKVFALLLPGAVVAEAKAIAERIRSEITNNPLMVNGQPVEYTVSMGVTEFRSNDERELVIKRANQSLEAAQNSGGNQMMALTANDSAPLAVATKL
jgi:diguanylate cyclase (GGDEF)-like protein